MGLHEVAEQQDEDRRRRFTRAVLDDLRALERMCAEGLIEGGIHRIGAEQEMFLVDRSGRPAPVAVELLAALDHAPGFTTEIGRFNLEVNLTPAALGAGCLAAMEADLIRQLQRVRQAARTLDADVLLAGILPSLELADLRLDNLTPLPRYHELNRIITELTGGQVRTLIQGRDNLQVTLGDIMLEAANTSFQVHLQVSADAFARFYNVAQVVAGPMVALAANSLLLLQHRLWHETRIPAFEQTLDIRTVPNRIRDTWQRVSFGDGWVRHSVLELFQDQVARHRATLLRDTGELSTELLDRGEIPCLQALCLHNGSVYRWNRPCYGVLDGKPHLRIEHRPLPAGPTIADEVANAAVFFGLMLGLEATMGDVRPHFAFSDVRGNFIAGARYGLDATFSWSGGRSVAARALLLDELLPLAREGLASAGISPEEVDRYLGIAEARVRSGRNGARWTQEAFDSLEAIGSRTVRCQLLTRAIHARQWNGHPVHEWTLPTPDEHGQWQERYRRVGQVMTTDVFTVGPDDLVDVAASVMRWKHIRHVPVEDGAGRLVGLVSYRSLLRLVAEGRTQQPVAIRDVMQVDPLTVSPDLRCLDAIRLMRERGVACLPVVLDGKLVGIVSERDFLHVASLLMERVLQDDEA